MLNNVSCLWRVVVCAVFGLSSLAFQGTLCPTAAQQKSGKTQRPRVINTKELSREQFWELLPILPDKAVLEADGKRITVGEFKARSEQQKAAAQARMDAAARAAADQLERLRAAFRESEKARLDAARRELLASFESQTQPSAELQAQLQAIREEMRKLLQRARTASPNEQEEILRRADELVRKYSQLTTAPKSQ